MTKRIGKQIVYLYGKNIPKSGKSVFEFGGMKMCHRSIGADKSDLLVHIDSKIIVRSYPAKTERSVVLDDMAYNIKKIEHFLHHPESYDVQPKPDAVKIKKDDEDVVYDTHREPSYSRSGNYNHLNKDVAVKKKYNQKEFRW